MTAPTTARCEQFLPKLLAQIRWFQRERAADPEGFYYTDITGGSYESGIDQGIRFVDVPRGPFACVDATSHIYLLCETAARWCRRTGLDCGKWEQKAQQLRQFITTRLFSPRTGFFHDAWLIDEQPAPRLAFEGIWPVVVGAATEQQAQQVIDQNLLNPQRFFTPHPISTVAATDPRFELRMWRGPAWNSMTLWAARGCMRYGRPDAAAKLAAAALDTSARQFARSGTIWEFYHPHAGDPQQIQRKPQTRYNTPCPDYLGHNPLIALARLHDRAAAE